MYKSFSKSSVLHGGEFAILAGNLSNVIGVTPTHQLSDLGQRRHSTRMMQVLQRAETPSSEGDENSCWSREQPRGSGPPPSDRAVRWSLKPSLLDRTTRVILEQAKTTEAPVDRMS